MSDIVGTLRYRRLGGEDDGVSAIDHVTTKACLSRNVHAVRTKYTQGLIIVTLESNMKII